MKGDEDVTVPTGRQRSRHERNLLCSQRSARQSLAGGRALMAKLANVIGRPIPMTAGKGMRRCTAECTRVGGHHTADELSVSDSSQLHGERVFVSAEAIKANPTKSNRAIGAELVRRP
jgi:hypothetical protein